MNYDNVSIKNSAFCNHKFDESSEEYQNILNINSSALECVYE